jgi:hypothetical protein
VIAPRPRLLAAAAGVLLGAGVLVGVGAARGAGGSPGAWAEETHLSPAERRELRERRAALESEVTLLLDRAGACEDPRSRVRQSLAAVRHVRGVEVGSVLLTSSPPRVPVAVGIALNSGRVVWDRLMVTVAVRPWLLPLGSADSDAPAPVCRSPQG